MIYKKVFYSRKGDVFEVQFDDKKITVHEDKWNSFLDQHSTNLKHEGKRLSGSDSVDEKALKAFIDQL
jgi:hypothetical protein